MTRIGLVAASLAAFILAAGCTAPAGKTSDIEARVLAVETRMEAHEKQLLQIASSQEDVRQKVSGMDTGLGNVRRMLNDLVARKSEEGTSIEVVELAENRSRVEDLIMQLREAKEWNTLVSEFRKYGKTSVWRLKEYLVGGDKVMREKVMGILALMGPADVIPQVMPWMTDKTMSMQTRLTVVEVLEKMRHPEAVKALDACLWIGDGEFTNRVAMALASSGTKLEDRTHDRVVCILIALLRNSESYTRDLANNALQQLTEKSFGYKLGAPLAENESAVVGWEQWWQEMRAKMMEKVLPTESAPEGGQGTEFQEEGKTTIEKGSQ